MRLLDTTTIGLPEYFVGDIPPYAILSHTWDKEGVFYQEMISPVDSTMQKAGYIKIHRFAELAKSHGHKYIWVDTCCIDKSNGAELSEAINSMYKWYQHSNVCFAYLSDVSKPTTNAVSLEGHNELSSRLHS